MLTLASRFEILRPHTEIHNTSHMRTKTLLLTAAIAAAGAASAMAQNVYSVNAVGYVNKAIPSGYTLLANPFVVADQTIHALIPTAPDGTTIYKPLSGSFTINAYIADIGDWDPNPAETIPLGEGVIIYNPGSAFTVTFVGEVKQGSPVSNPISSGLSVKSSMVPQSGSLSTALGFNPTADTVTYQYTTDGTGGFIINSYAIADGFWDPAEPTLGVAEALWFDSRGGQVWTRNFSVN
jgi:Flp pilus assembly protein CpaB